MRRESSRSMCLLNLVLVSTLVFGLSAEEVSVQDLNGSDDGALQVVLTCPKPGGSNSHQIPLDPHVVVKRDGSDIPDEVGLHRSGAWADTRWHGQGRLGESPFVRVSPMVSKAGLDGQHSIITLGASKSGEYRIFVVKPQAMSRFPPRCSIAVLASGDVDSTFSLGKVQVADATSSAACSDDSPLKKDALTDCNYWEAGRLQCNNDACELHHTNRIAHRNPATGHPSINEPSHTPVDPNGLGEENKEQVSEAKVMLSAAVRRQEEAAKAHTEAQAEHEHRLHAARRNAARLTKLRSQLAVTVTKANRKAEKILNTQIGEAVDDVKHAQNAAEEASKDVIATEQSLVKSKMEKVKAAAAMAFKNLNDAVKHTKERMQEAEDQQKEYKRAKAEARSTMQALQKKQEHLRDQENRARAAARAAKLEIETAKTALENSDKEYAAARSTHREAIERQERKKVEKEKWDTRLKAAESQTDVESETHFGLLKRDMQTKLAEVIAAISSVTSIVKHSHDSVITAQKRHREAQAALDSAQKRATTASHKANTARAAWLKVRESVRNAVKGRDAAAKQVSAARKASLDREGQLLKLSDQKQEQTAAEETAMMHIKVEAGKIEVEQDRKAIDEEATKLERLKKKSLEYKAQMPKLVRAAAAADAKAKASNMAFSAAWVRVFKLKKAAKKAAAISANARRVALLRAKAVTRLSKRLKEMMKKEQKSLSAMSQADQGLNVVEQLDNTAKRARLDLVRFRLDKATKAAAQAEAQVKQYHGQEEEYKNGVSTAEADANKYKAAMSSAKAIANEKGKALNELVVHESHESTQATQSSQSLAKKKQLFSKDTQAEEATEAAARQLSRQEHQAKVIRSAEDLKTEEKEATAAAYEARTSAEKLQQESEQLRSKIAQLMDTRADYRARADLAQRAEKASTLRLKEQQKKSQVATESIQLATSQKNKAQNSKASLLAEVHNAQGGDKQRLEYMVVENDEKEVSAEEQAQDSAEALRRAQESEKREMMSANAYSRQEAVLRSEEKKSQDHEATVQQELKNVKSRLQKAKQTEKDFNLKADELHAQAMKMAHLADGAVYKGRVDEARTDLDAVKLRESKMDAELHKTEGSLEKEQAKILLENRLEKKSASRLAADDAAQKATVMEQADAAWAAQEDKKRLDLDVQEMKDVRGDVLKQQAKVDKLAKKRSQVNDKIAKISADITAATDDETKELQNMQIEERAVFHKAEALKRAREKARTTVVSEEKYITKERTKMDEQRHSQDAKAKHKMSERDHKIENAQKAARQTLRKAILQEEVARKIWLKAGAKAAGQKNVSHASIGHLRTAYRQASEAYVTAASMAIGVARYTSQDKLTAEHNIKQLSHEKMKRIKMEADALAVPVRRLDSLSVQAQDQIDELRAELKMVELHNSKVNATKHRKIEDITLAATQAEHEFLENATEAGLVERKDTKELATKKIQKVRQDYVVRFHPNEVTRLKARLAEAEQHRRDIDDRLKERHQELANLTVMTRSTIKKNLVLEKNTTKLASAVVKEAFQTAKDAERAKDNALAKLQQEKHRWRKRIKALETAVTTAMKAHKKRQMVVQKAQEAAEKVHGHLRKQESMERKELKEQKMNEKRSENATLLSQLEAAEEEKEKILKGPKAAMHAEKFKLDEAKQKEKRAHERKWELNQDLQKLKVERDDLPRRLQEAQVEQAKDNEKLGILEHSETKAAGALVGARKVARMYSKKSDSLVSKETMDSTQLRKEKDEEQQTRVKEDTDRRTIATAHKEIRKLQAEVLRHKSAELLAQEKQKQGTLASKIEELVANGHRQADTAKGLLAKADAARESTDTVVFKADVLAQQTFTRAAKLAVAHYAADSLAGQAKDYAVLSKQAEEEIAAMHERKKHNSIKLEALRDTLKSVSMNNDTDQLTQVKEELGAAKTEDRMMKVAEARREQRARKVLAVAQKASEKAEWMKKQVVVKQLQYLASKRWLMMAEKEASLQDEVARKSLKSAYSAALAAAQAERDAQLLKAKSADLAMKVKIDILKEALTQTSAARQQVQVNLEKQHKKLRHESDTFNVAKSQANQKAKEASSMFSMGEAMRTAQYRAKTTKDNEKDGTTALKWEKSTSLAQTEEAKFEVLMGKSQMQLRTTAGAVAVSAKLLGSLNQQEFSIQQSLQDAILAQKGSQLNSERKAIHVMQSFRKKWLQQYRVIKTEASRAMAAAHKTSIQSLQTAAIAQGEAHVAKMAVQSAKRTLSQCRQQHQQALTAAEKARFKVEASRGNENDAQKELEQVKFRVREGHDSKAILDAANKKYTAARNARRTAAHLADVCSQESVEASNKMLEAKVEVDRREEHRLLSVETAKAAASRARKAHKHEAAARLNWEDATQNIEVLTAEIAGSKHKSHDVKAAIYVELLKHKQAMAATRASLAIIARNKGKALRYAAMKMLEANIAAAKHTAKAFKGLKKREAAMRRKAKTAEKRSRMLSKASIKSKKLFKAEEKAEEANQLKEFKDARNKVLAQKGNVTREEVEKDMSSLSRDSEKLAMAKAMQKAIEKEKEQIGHQQKEAMMAATRFTLAAKAERAEFPKFTEKVKESVKKAAKAQAILRDLTEKLNIARKAAQLSGEELDATNHAQLDGKKHWKNMQVCSKMHQNEAERQSLRQKIAKSASSSQAYEKQAQHFKQVATSQALLASSAKTRVQTLQESVDQAHKRLLIASQQADKAWRHRKVMEEQKAEWSAQAENALEPTEKGLLKERTKGAEQQLLKAKNEEQTRQQQLKKAEQELNQLEKSLRERSRVRFQHQARVKAARLEYASLQEQASKESQRGEALQVKLDHLSESNPSQEAECDGSTETGPRLSNAWKKEMLKSLVSYYLHHKQKTVN